MCETLNSEIYRWNFDILGFEQQESRVLEMVGFDILNEFIVDKVLHCSKKTLQMWLGGIAGKYRSNPYHSQVHAADVLQATSCLLKNEKLKKWLDEEDFAVLLIAAVIHDIDHPGKTNDFLLNTGDNLAKKYPCSTLENHHLDVAFKYTEEKQETNIFLQLEETKKNRMKELIKEIVLSTDMKFHKIHVENFIKFFTNPETKNAEISDDLKEEGKLLIMRIICKIADISNISRSWILSREWARRIENEFADQCDEEESSNLIVTMPDFIRHKYRFEKSQLNFIKFVAVEMFESFNEVFSIPEIINQLRINIQTLNSKLQIAEEQK